MIGPIVMMSINTSAVKSILRCVKPPIDLFVKSLLVVVLVFVYLLISGCEASLNLDGVYSERKKNIRRTDQLQGITANQSVFAAVGAAGVVLTSNKSTLDWHRQHLEGRPALVDITACPDNSLVILSIDKNIWRSIDNGKTWSVVSLPTQEDMIALACAPDNSIWVAGSFSTILFSKDNGKTWVEKTLNEDAMLTSIQFVDASHAIVTGEFGLVSHSSDGGVNWDAPRYIPDDFYVQTAVFTSFNNGWVGGLNGKILYTSDKGSTWQSQPTPTQSPIYGFYQLGPRLFAFGDHATILEYLNNQWVVLPNHNRPVYLRDAIALSGNELLFVGGFGSLFTLNVQRAETAQLIKH